MQTKKLNTPKHHPKPVVFCDCFWVFLIPSGQTHLPFIQGSPGNAAMPLMDKAPNGVMLWSFSSSSFNKWMHPSFANFGVDMMGTQWEVDTFLQRIFFGSKTPPKKSIYIYFFDLEHTFASPHELYFCSTQCFGEKDSNCRKAKIMDGIWCSWRPLNQRQCALCQQLPVTPIDFGPSSLAAWVCRSKPSHGPLSLSFLCQVAETWKNPKQHLHHGHRTAAWKTINPDWNIQWKWYRKQSFSTWFAQIPICINTHIHDYTCTYFLAVCLHPFWSCIWSDHWFFQMMVSTQTKTIHKHT